MNEKLRKNLIPIAIVVAGLLIAGAVIYVNRGKEGVLSPQAAAQKAIDFINKNLLQQGMTATLIGVVEENGLYKLNFKIGDKEYPSYVTKDGKILFPSEGINLEEKPETSTEQPKKMTCEDVKKADKPSLEAFVVSECPYGLQMQRNLS